MIGHSWISYLESSHNSYLHNTTGFDVKFLQVPFSQFEDIPKCIPENIDLDTTYVFVFSLYRMAYDRLVFRDNEGRLPHYAIFLPNERFRAEYAIPYISEILHAILKTAPKATVYFVIPTMPDLHYYNMKNIATGPIEVKEWYRNLPNTSPKDLCEANIKVYNQLQRLHTPQLKWAKKRTINMSDTVKFMSPKMASFLNQLSTSGNEIYSLGPKGYLIDGVNPSESMIYSFWKMISFYGILITDIPGSSQNQRQDDNYHYPASSSSGITTEKPPELHRKKLQPQRTYTGDVASVVYSRLSHSPVPQPSTSTRRDIVPELRRSFSREHNRRSLSPLSTNRTNAPERRSTLPSCLTGLNSTDIGLAESKINKCLCYLQALLQSRHCPASKEDLREVIEYFLDRYE